MSGLPGRWHRIELRHLLALEAVADEPSFVEAARRLGYGQSAVSQQLKVLEELVGHCLVERARGRRGARLTDDGERFLERARAILGEARAAAAVESCARIRIAAARGVAITHLVAALPSGRATFDLDEGMDRGAVLRGIDAGSVDAGCITGAVPAHCDSVPLYRDRWVALERPGSPAGPLRSSRPIVLRGTVDGTALAGVLPAPAAVAESATTVAMMVGAGLGTGVVPESLVRAWRDRLRVRELDDERVDATLDASLVWRRGRPLKPALVETVGRLRVNSA
ncbi:MAG TPA: LysR family transcriptional regulator [Gaiellaceae bacterium]